MEALPVSCSRVLCCSRPHTCVLAAGVIWCMKFSKNGKYLATSGSDGIVRVWEVVLFRGQPEKQAAAAEEAAVAAAAAAGEIQAEGRPHMNGGRL